MKFFISNSFPGWASSLVKTSVVVAGLATMTACASIGGFVRPNDSPLPITTSDAATARAYETSDRLYVTGGFRRFPGSPRPLAAHVDVQLINRNGRILAEKREGNGSTVHPDTTGGRSRRTSFTASFPLEVARQASSVRVIYHSAAHADTGSTDASAR